MKDKNVAGVLALFLGWLGVHRFYLGQVGLGILYIILNVFFFIPFFVSLIDAIVFFSQDKDAFDLKYNKSHFKAVRKERPDFQRNDRRWEERQRERSQRAGQRQQQRSQRTNTKAPTRKPRHNPYKASGIEKYKEYDYDGAIEDFKKALEIDDRDIATHFNVACAYSLNEEVENAFYHLDRAVALGFNDFRRIKEHDALAFLRIQDGFDEFEENGFQLKKKMAAPAENPEQTEETEEGLQLPSDLLDQLNKLNELKNKGLLTEEEFAVQKNKLMN